MAALPAHAGSESEDREDISAAASLGVLAQGGADRQPFFDVVRGQHAHEAVTVPSWNIERPACCMMAKAWSRGNGSSMNWQSRAITSRPVASPSVPSHAGQQVDTV